MRKRVVTAANIRPITTIPHVDSVGKGVTTARR